MTGNDNNAGGTWICKCGNANTGKFCVKCGESRPEEPAPPAEWVCACGVRNTGKFCVKCGEPRPAVNPKNAPRPVNGAVTKSPRSSKPEAAEAVARQAAEARAAQEAAERRAAEEAAARQAAEARLAQEAAARKAAEEAAARQAAEARMAQEASSAPVAKANDNKGMLMKVAIGVLVLLLLIAAYFMFGKKKETPPAPEPPKVETKAEKKEEPKAETEKPMDPAVKAEKIRKYAEAMKAANAQKKEDATKNEKFVFLAEDVRRTGNDLIVSGHFYNGRKNRTIISIKSMELDIVLRDVDKELMNEKNIKYENSFTGMNIKPLQESQLMTVILPGKAPDGEFNSFMVTAHDVRWEAVGE